MQPDNSPENSCFHHQLIMAGNGLTRGFPVAMQNNRQLEGGRAYNNFAAACENHKEAERKRRERINAHLDHLRTLLLCTSKTDKASLLAKVVQRVRELKQQTSEIMQFDQTFPSESDEIAVFTNDNESLDGKSVVKASLCCEDRIDLIPELIEILKPLPLRPLRAEMATMGGRIRNVIVLSGEKNQMDESVLLLKDSLKTLILRSSYPERSKRRRMFDQGN